MDDILLIDRRGPVVVATLNRPGALNALSVALEDRLRGFYQAASADADLRAIVLTGAGRAFSVGVDLKELGGDPAAMDQRVWHGPESLFEIIRACPVPTIAAVNGFAVTGGLELAMTSDFIVAGASAKFADTHARVGITPSWGMSQILPRLIGPARAARMSLTGAYIDAATAADWGLAAEVVADEALLDHAVAMAEEIAETDKPTMGKLRALLREGQSLGLDDALAREREVFDAHMAGVTPAGVAEARGRVTARGRAVNDGT